MFSCQRSFLLVSAVVIVCAVPMASAQAQTRFGEAGEMGQGTIKSYAVFDNGVPTAIGLVFEASALEGLPINPNMTGRCFDIDKNGRIDGQNECEGDYELRLPMPREITSRDDVRFVWAAVNWNPHGHVPPPWQVPHFDFHFYMVSEADIDGIRVGGCEIFVDCDDKKRGLVPVAAKHVHPDHVSVDAVVGKMGNHLIDSRTPEFSKENPKEFTHTWIFGAYDGHVTFYEPMITLQYLNRRRSGCYPIKQPEAWEHPGYYPTVYCIRYSDTHKSFTVSLEAMKLRE